THVRSDLFPPETNLPVASARFEAFTMSQNRRLFQILLLACGVCLSSVVAFAEEPAAEGEAKPEKVSYYNQIRPIFQDNCQGCHQPAKPEGGFVMTTVETMQKGGDSEEPAFEPGDPD